ncbi:hypothetical protein KQX54_004996 [Cotesia glomerata]|uniref:Uncharacterized protein n=1 Tax=Cotesia glomerata TaxID=32391 RepID=A0AAV7I2F0_COTGL|nr:hypothetical protein KQX54_004996 [Cotesia glomerata]
MKISILGVFFGVLVAALIAPGSWSAAVQSEVESSSSHEFKPISSTLLHQLVSIINYVNGHILNTKLGEIYNKVVGVFENSTLSTDKIVQATSAKLSDKSFQVCVASKVISGIVGHESNSSQKQVDRSQFLNSSLFKSSADDTQAEIVFDKPFIILLLEEKTKFKLSMLVSIV